METFDCALCLGTFERKNTEEQAQAEAASVFGKPIAEWSSPPIVVCDDCYAQVHPLAAENIEKLLIARQNI